MAATAISGGMPFDDSVGTAPPWLRKGGPVSRDPGDLGGSLGNMADPSVPRLGGVMNVSGMAPPTMSGSGNQPGYGDLASAMTGISSGPSGAGGGSFDPWATSRAMSGVGAASNAGAALGGSGSGYQSGGGGVPGMTDIGTPGTAMGAPVSGSSPGSGVAAGNLGSMQNDLRSTIESAYNASGTGSSANQPGGLANGGMPAASSTGSMAKVGTSAPVPSSSGNPVLDTYMQSGGGPTPGASNPAADAVMGAPVTPSMPQTGGAMNVAAPPPPSMGTPSGSSTPGITLGSQQAFAGGPSVTTSNVNYGGLPSVSTDFSGDAQRAADSAYKGATQYFNEDFTRSNNDLQNQLINQGFAPGSEAFTRQMELQQRGQDQARTGAALAAQQQGFQNAGDLLQRALAARQQGVSELNTSADRTFNQSLGVAGLGLGARGQDLGLQGAQAGASATMGAAGANASAANYRADLDAELQRRQLGLSQDSQDFNQMMQLANLSQGSVPGLNFGAATPLDVGGAYNTSVAANNAAANRTASNNNALYTLGGNLLGSYLRGGAGA